MSNSGSFSQCAEPNVSWLKDKILEGICADHTLSQYDQYKHYQYRSGFSSHDFFLHRIKSLLLAENGDWHFFYELTGDGPFLIGTRISKWDEDHFGFKMAALHLFTAPTIEGSEKKLYDLIELALRYLKNKSVEFVSSRINGDQLAAVHAMESSGFRYYDNVIWPISAAKDFDEIPEVRLMKPAEIDKVKYLAENFQYRRGHYYCDSKFDQKSVNSMYIKWVDSTIKAKEFIAVIEHNQEVAGFFAFKIDNELERFTGYRYGRLKLLAIDDKVRGKGLGEQLFRGTLALIKGMGADFIDSGYSTKNHISSKLHVKTSFFSKHEEVTFHLWLK